ncbi:MAG: vWA domain-containing protein [Dichotomicrobium sp.]
MRGLFIKFFAVLTGFAALAATGPGSGPAVAQNRVIVLDATNSMWGPIEGGRKYQIARDAIESAARSLSPESRLGLYVVGNQPGAGCEAVTQAMPLSPLDADKLSAAFDQAIPDRGRMPLIPAVEQAAKAIRSAGGEGRILVIGDDGAGTCVPDACATARALEGVRIDAVSLDADADTRDRLQCIAEATGGAYENGTTRSEVAEFVQAALAGDAPDDASAPRPQAEEQPPAPPLPAANPFRPGQSPVVTLRAVLAQGRDPIEDGLAWRIFEQNGADDDTAVIWRGAGPQPAVNLPQGHYRVEVSYGLVTANREIEVRPRREQTITIDLDAAVLKLSGASSSGGEPVEDVFYYVHRLAQGSDGAGELVARSSQPQPSFYLPAGRYRVVVRHGLAEAEDTVDLEAGAILGRNLALNAGTLRVEARIAEGQPVPRGTIFFVYEPDGDGGWREVVRSARQQPSFTLPAGEYRVEARLDTARADALVDIRAGENVVQDLTLPAGRLRVETRLEGASKPLEAGVVYRMLRLDDGETDLVHTSAQAVYEGFLPAGRYRVESAYGTGNATQTQEVSLKAGQTRSLTFTHNAGRAQLGLVKVKGGLTLGRVNWSIRNSQGEEIFESADSVPEPLLRAGQYVAIAERQGETVRAAFTVSPNQTTVVELVAQ